MRNFKNKEVLKKAWTLTKENLWLLAGLYAVFFILTFVVSDIFFLSTLVNVFMNIIIISTSLRIIEKKKVGFNNLIDDFNWKIFFNFLIAHILISVFTVIGFALLIVPGFVVATMLSMTSYMLVDKKESHFWQAIKASKKITSGFKWRIFVFWVVAVGVNILGAIALGVGLLFTLPLTVIAFTLIYKELSKDGSVSAEKVN